MKSYLKHAYGVMVGPPRYFVGNEWLNRAGLQLARIAWHRLFYELRPRIEPTGSKDAGGITVPRSAAEIVKDIQRDCYTVVPDFFPAEVFARLEQAFQDLASAPEIKTTDNWVGSTIRCTSGYVTDRTEAGRFVHQTLAQNPIIQSVVSTIMRRPVKRPPGIHYQSLYLPEGRVDKGEPGQVLHADRYFPTVKVVLYMNDNTVEGGATIYCPGSHKLTPRRLRHEYRHSIADAKLRKSYGLPPQAWFTNDAWRVHDERGPTRIPQEAREDLGLREVSIVGKKNTLVIGDHVAFHRRGVMQPGTERKHLRLIFHQVEESWYAAPLMWLAQRRRLSAQPVPSAAM